MTQNRFNKCPLVIKFYVGGGRNICRGKPQMSAFSSHMCVPQMSAFSSHTGSCVYM